MRQVSKDFGGLRAMAKGIFLAGGLGLAVGAAAPAQAQSIATPVKPNVSLPGGASSLTETHDDWTVGCSVQADGKRCVMSQALGNKQTGQRLLSMELQPKDGAIEGVILAPFGLRLAKGLTLKVDDQEQLGEPAGFTTCVEAGCVVPIAFDADQISKLSSGETLTINAENGSTSEPVKLTISLKGFDAARKRSAELMQ
ncbi:invasion associated locus B family protein [Methyloligella solikamskensis]|uniref:Invasion associated locus B family protein n=1 Tax=Methyloligella solikamskensis TaxID=1177756 RepID=A0ABW3JA81_9HYPH